MDRIEIEVDRSFSDDLPTPEKKKVLDRLRLRLAAEIGSTRETVNSLRVRVLWALFERAEQAAAEGGDLLNEQAAELDATAASLREQIDAFAQDSQPT